MSEWSTALIAANKIHRGTKKKSTHEILRQKCIDLKHDGVNQLDTAKELKITRWLVRTLLNEPAQYEMNENRMLYHYTNKPWTFDPFEPIIPSTNPKPDGLWISVETIEDPGWWEFLDHNKTCYRTPMHVDMSRIPIIESPWDDIVEGLAIPFLSQPDSDREWSAIIYDWDGLMFPNYTRNMEYPSSYNDTMLKSINYFWWDLLDVSSMVVWNYARGVEQVGPSEIVDPTKPHFISKVPRRPAIRWHSYVE